jgi:hypothetical protein
LAPGLDSDIQLVMKKIIFSVILLGFSVFLTAQTVDSIKVEQAGDFIKIRYKILNSNPNQLFRVTISCSINGGLKSELRTLLGDFGENVPGGKPEYTAIWDVLKDVDEVNSVDFSVKAELTRGDLSELSDRIKIKKEPKKNFNIMPVLQLPGPGFGIRLGYMGEIGFSLQYTTTSGRKILMPGVVFPEGNPRINRYSFDFTIRIVNKKSFQAHLLIGSTAGDWTRHYPDEPADWNVHFTGGIDAGLAFYLRSLAFSITGAKYFTSLTEMDGVIADSKTTFLTFGAGLRF